MSLYATLVLLAGTLGLLGVAAWRLRRPWRPGRLWRVPWGAVAAVCLVLILGVLAHLISLWSGRPLPPRGF